MPGNGEILVENLVKRYGDFLAVNDISFKVDAGEIFGFLGPNGAGKSTTLSIMTTLSLPTTGQATVGGFNVSTQAAQVRQVSGVALQEVGLDPLMTGLEVLTLQAQLFGMSARQARNRASDLLELIKLNESQILKRRIGQYSGGMRRRLDLALALTHQPKILFLDEPTTGLDPASRRDIWLEVRRLNQQLGMTIFLTTQYLEEADELANRVAIINGGKIVAAGTPTALKAELGEESINVTFRTAEVAQQSQQLIGFVSATPARVEGATLRLYMSEAATQIPWVVSRLQEAHLDITSLTLTQPTLDDVFLEVTGRRLQMEEATSTSPEGESTGRPTKSFRPN